MSALLKAAAAGDTGALAAALDSGIIIDSRDSHERTGLHVAAAAGHADAVSLLLERGADVDAEDEV